MSKLIFLNLPVRDLARATAFYEAVGATRNARFSDETAACLVVSETIHVMLMTHDKFRQFSPKPIADPQTSEVLICLSAESRAAVDAIIERAAGADGTPDPSPKQDHGFMYGRSFEDLDGHVWEIMWMDAAAMTGCDDQAASA